MYLRQTLVTCGLLHVTLMFNLTVGMVAVPLAFDQQKLLRKSSCYLSYGWLSKSRLPSQQPEMQSQEESSFHTPVK